MDTIDEWINLQKANNLDEGTLKTYRFALQRVSNYKPLDKITKKDLINYFANFDKSESVKLLTSIIIKRFFRDNGKPDIVDWLKIEKPADNFDPKKVLTQEDIEVIIEAADSHYFKALLAFLWDTGCRWSEAHLIKWGDLIDTTEGFEAHVPTKKKKNGGYAFRKMFLAESSKYLRNHQISSYSNSNELIFGMTYRAEIEMLKNVKKRVNVRINKPITFHKLRHARATHLTKFNVNDDYMRKMFGWSPTSTVPSRYKHLNDEDVVKMQKNLLGKGHSEPPKPRPISEPPPLKLQNMAETLFEMGDNVQKLSGENESLQNQVRILQEWVDKQKSEIDGFKEEFEKHYEIKERDLTFQAMIFSRLSKKILPNATEAELDKMIEEAGAELKKEMDAQS